MIDMNKYMKIAYITLICLFTTSNSFSQIKNNRMENYKSTKVIFILIMKIDVKQMLLSIA